MSDERDVQDVVKEALKDLGGMWSPERVAGHRNHIASTALTALANAGFVIVDLNASVEQRAAAVGLPMTVAVVEETSVPAAPIVYRQPSNCWCGWHPDTGVRLSIVCRVHDLHESPVYEYPGKP